MEMISHYEFLTRSIARFELIAYAKALGWPLVEYRNSWGVRVRLEGQQRWNECGLGSVDGRRDAWLQLVEIECRTLRESKETVTT